MKHVPWRLPARVRGRPRSAGRMTGLERDYAEELRIRHAAGEVVWWDYEPLKFRLADNTFYTPDFAVLLADGSAELELVEVKGHWEDDARVKIKVAAAHYWMFRFVAVRHVRGSGFVREEIPAGIGR